MSKLLSEFVTSKWTTEKRKGTIVRCQILRIAMKVLVEIHDRPRPEWIRVINEAGATDTDWLC